MEEKSTSCNLSLISRFYDNELFGEEIEQVKAHIRSCSNCKNALHEMVGISSQIKRYIKNNSPLTEDRSVEYYVIDEIHKNDSPWWVRFKDLIFSKKIIIPVTAIAVFTLVIVTLIQPINKGPSAIIDSVSGEVSSIVILETPDTHETILWFNENNERQS